MIREISHVCLENGMQPALKLVSVICTCKFQENSSTGQKISHIQVYGLKPGIMVIKN